MRHIPEDNSVQLEESQVFDDKTKLDIETTPTEDAIRKLPVDFKITTTQDIRILQKYLSNKFKTFTYLFRGHESNQYRLESTIARVFKGSNITTKVIAEAEKDSLQKFTDEIYKEQWLECQHQCLDDTLFKLSTARHLGLSCRLIDVTARLETAVLFAVSNPNHYHQDGELIVIIFDKNQFVKPSSSTFDSEVYYSHAPFLCNSLSVLPIGEYRRFHQNGHFIFVGDDYLLQEEDIIKQRSEQILRIPIPSYAKIRLAQDLWTNLYDGFAYQSEISKINQQIKQTNNSTQS